MSMSIASLLVNNQEKQRVIKCIASSLSTICQLAMISSDSILDSSCKVRQIIADFCSYSTRIFIGFEDVTAIIFCVAMSEYDQVLHEDETTVRYTFYARGARACCFIESYARVAQTLRLDLQQ